MKSLNSPFIVLLFGVILAQFVYAESVTLEANGLNKKNIQLLSVDGADHFFRDFYVDDIVDAVVDLMEASQ
ncbi:MAG: hypothetical protein L3J22_02395 [Xanthomonadales bacterium]|nr:hypothetical protein [Xanthomonadales bacterium]